MYGRLSECDCLVLLGTDYPFDTLLPQTPTLVQIDDEGSHIGRRSRIDFGLTGTLKNTIQSLIPLITPHASHDFLSKALKTAQDTESTKIQHLNKMSHSPVLRPEYVTHQLSELADPDAIFIIDVGLNDKWAARLLQPTPHRTIMGSFKHGTMAAAVGEAIGAAFAHPTKQIIVLAGDGDLTMLLGDLLTIIQYNLPIHIIIYNNQELGYINFEATLEGYEPFGTHLQNPDFSKIGTIMGFNSFKLDDTAHVVPILKKALSQHTSTLIDAYTDPTALGIPNP